MIGATGYGMYGIYESQHKQHGNSAQTYIATAGTALSVMFMLLMLIEIMKMLEKSIRENGEVKNWCIEIQNGSAYTFFPNRAFDFGQFRYPRLSIVLPWNVVFLNTFHLTMMRQNAK